MANIKRPEGIDIAALREKRVEYVDVMAPGAGTPWEERGALGLFVAFFKTAFASMFSPVKLTHLIRRPETMTDVRGFLIGCSFFWAVSWVIHATMNFYHYSSLKDWRTDPPTYFMGVAIKFVVAMFMLFVLLNVYSALYMKLVSTEWKKGAPFTLLKNVKAYCLGPSLLAIIPYAGPIVAVVWIFVSFCAVGTRRLRISTSGAIIGTALAMLATLALGVGVYFGIGLVYNFVTGGGLEYVEPRGTGYYTR